MTPAVPDVRPAALARDGEGGARYGSGVRIRRRPGRPAVTAGRGAGRDQARARALRAVEDWRAQHPDGWPEEMLADLGRGFRADSTPPLCALLLLVDLERARAAGVTVFTWGDR